MSSSLSPACACCRSTGDRCRLRQAIGFRDRVRGPADCAGGSAGLVDAVRVLPAAADNDELTAMAELVLLCSLRRISLSPFGHVVPLWGTGWQDVLWVLRDGDGDGAEAVARMRAYSAGLTAGMREDRPLDAALGPVAQG